MCGIILKKYIHVFTFSILYHSWTVIQCRELKFTLKEGKELTVIAADDLVTQGVRASAGMLLTGFRQNILGPTQKGL